MTRVKVAVRVRPLSNREVDSGSTSIVAVECGRTVAVTNTKVPEQNAGDSRERIRRFTFDYCFQEDSTQDHVFEEIEKVIGQSVRRRYHSCVLAYGQSSSGKTHTMMGFPHDPGLTPKLCHKVFGYLQETAVGDEVLDLKVSVSYLEIYNEKVRDLLRKENSDHLDSFKKNQPLKIREHPKKGPYVQGLSEHSVTDSNELLEWLEFGNKQRRVAATLTNSRSSRSHSVFSISCDGVKLHLIDLAGSERAGSRCYGTSQFREGANINKSLVALGNVISALAEHTKGIRRKFVPYRDSVLTWLLKDTLGGNSNTVMVATVSPSSACYSETVNTLRFGQRAKLIVSHPVVHEDPKEKTIRELRAEIAKLKDLLKLSQLSMLEDRNGEPKEKQKCSKETQSESITDPSTKTEDEIKEPNGKLTDDSDEATKNSNTEQINNISLSSNNDHSTTLVDGGANFTETTNEQLVPLLNVTTSIKPKKPIKLRRTYSVDHTYIDKQRQKMFGSDESIPSTSTTSKMSHSSSSLEKQKSQESISRRNPVTGSSSSLLRRRSLNKSNPMLPKTPIKRRSLENNTQKFEKSTTTEGLNIKNVEPKVNSIRKQPIKPRSQIVAAVTSRLYSKVNRKEAATNTEEPYVPRTQTTRDASTNAKSRLREITRRALRAHRQKHEQTQTEMFQVTRVREIATDVDDLQVCLQEVKHAETQPIAIETKDASVNCTFLKQLSEEEKRNTLSITRSCGTQFSQDENEKETSSTKTNSNPISFTKYLRGIEDPKYEISDVMPNSPIYTRTVNINISHNYISETRGNGSISDDSIEQNAQNVCLPTPDLISNHNSLEQNHEDSESSQQAHEANKINYANTEVLEEYFSVTENSASPKEKKCSLTRCVVIPKCSEEVQSVTMEKVQAPEICVVNKFEEGTCKPIPRFVPDVAKPKIVETKYFTCDDCIKLEEPLVLKSIVKQLPNGLLNENSSSDEELVTSDLPDSLDYHMANTKKVKFNKKSSNQPPDNGRMLNAMSEFLEEATNLMNNLTMAASKIGSNNLHLDDSYEFEVTVNDLRGLGKSFRKKNKAPRTKQAETTTPNFSVNKDCSTQCEMEYSFPINKYEALVEESCRRLEEKINKIPIQQHNVHLSNEYHSYNGDDQMDPYYHYNPWEPHSLGNDVEDSSLESNPVTYSDYGSLPRKTHKRQRTPTCSPSAFLRQLTNMRKQIIETSREEFMSCPHNH